MKNINKQQSLIFIALTIAAIWGVNKFTHYLQKAEPIKPATIEDQYRIQLQQLEKDVWQSLAQFEITPEKVQALKEKDYAIFLEMCDRPYKEPVSDEIKKLAEPIFKEFNVDINTISLIKWDKHPACASDTKMYINEKDLLALSEETRKFTIAHELQHIINKDHSTDFIITGMLPENERGFNQSYDHPLLKYYRLRELRADLQVALKSSEWAKRYEICMNEIYKFMDGDTNGPMHPKTSYRITLAENISQSKPHQIIL